MYITPYSQEVSICSTCVHVLSSNASTNSVLRRWQRHRHPPLRTWARGLRDSYAGAATEMVVSSSPSLGRFRISSYNFSVGFYLFNNTNSNLELYSGRTFVPDWARCGFMSIGILFALREPSFDLFARHLAGATVRNNIHPSNDANVSSVFS